MAPPLDRLAGCSTALFHDAPPGRFTMSLNFINFQRSRYVRFGSKADMCGAREHVRFTPNSDHKSRHAALVMSALHLKADMCGANRHVCFGPKADMRLQHLKDI
jgi:hypothetical protein